MSDAFNLDRLVQVLLWVLACFAIVQVGTLLLVRKIRRRAAIDRAAAAHAEELAAACEQWRRRYEEMRDGVPAILKERDGWKGLYFQSASQHGVAQVMLGRENAREHRENARLRAVLEKAGLEAGQASPADPAVATIVQDFARRFPPDLDDPTKAPTADANGVADAPMPERKA